MFRYLLALLLLAGCPPDEGAQVVLEDCTNLVDDDQDGLVDCADEDCGGVCPEVCTDLIDNDQDGLIDCQDDDCDGSCAEICDDGRDNDADGSIDCQDLDCFGQCPEDCTDGLDNDADGFVDCVDPDCADPSCDELCTDGVDNDADGLVDCEDEDCNISGCAEDCDDGRDNDADGFVDCLDTDCSGSCPEDCSDFLDNDGDGLVDCEDTEECGALCDTDGDTYIDVEYGGDDCDDELDTVNPGMTEICDGVDNDCNTLIDEDDAGLDVTSLIRYHLDEDEDGYGQPATFEWSCSPIDGYADNMLDCNDDDDTINPDATEICDIGVDNDCDGLVDDADDSLDLSSTPTWFEDNDGDGFGSTEPEGGVYTCQPPALSGWASNSDDCNDSNATIGSSGDWWEDTDGDGYGSGDLLGIDSCYSPGAGYAPVWRGEDCGPTDDTIHPNAEEICEDEIDQDCDLEDDPCETCGDIRITTTSWGNEVTFQIGAPPDSSEVCECTGGCSGGPYADYTTTDYYACWTPGTCYFRAADSYGDGWHGGSYRIVYEDGSWSYEGFPEGYGESIPLP